MGRFSGLLALLLMFSVGQMEVVNAQETGVTEGRVESDDSDSRDLKKYGVYLSIGNPYPTLLGLNGAYNINKNLRASIGYGEVEVTLGGSGSVSKIAKAQTYAAGAEYLFFNSAVQGVAGLRAGYFHVTGDGKFDVDGFDESTAYLYSNLGIDWVSDGGYQLGAGVNVAFAGASSSSMYINSGWFF